MKACWKACAGGAGTVTLTIRSDPAEFSVWQNFKDGDDFTATVTVLAKKISGINRLYTSGDKGKTSIVKGKCRREIGPKVDFMTLTKVEIKPRFHTQVEIMEITDGVVSRVSTRFRDPCDEVPDATFTFKVPEDKPTKAGAVICAAVIIVGGYVVWMFVFKVCTYAGGCCIEKCKGENATKDCYGTSDVGSILKRRMGDDHACSDEDGCLFLNPLFCCYSLRDGKMSWGCIFENASDNVN